MAKRKTVRKKSSKKTAKKAARKTAARKKVTRKKAPQKKAAKKKAKKKVSRKKAKQKVKKKAAKKASRRKVAKKKSRKKVAKKNKVTKKKSRKKASKKKASRKKVSRKKVTKKKASKKKAAKKKAAKKKVSKKKVSKKKVSKKASTAKKAKKASAQTEQTTETEEKPRKKNLIIKPVNSRIKRPKLHTPVNPADQIPLRPRRRRNTGGDHLIHGIAPYKPAKGEEYMSDDQLEHFRRILNAWKEELMEEVDRTVHHMQDEASNFPDPTDRATQESEFGLELRTRDRERKLLKKIHQALARVDDGSYGYCEETGEEIGLKRLEARPVATLSVEAQERRELAERQYRDQDDRYR